MQDNGQQRSSSAGAVRMAGGAILGAIAAAAAGFGASALLASRGLGVVAASEGARSSTLGRLLLNFEAIHHAGISGSSLGGADAHASVNIVWPLSTWAVIPALALILGGFIAARVARASAVNRFLAGALTALPYTAILLILLPWSTASSPSVALPQIPVQGMQFDLSLIALSLRPEVLSAVLMGLLFGIIFGGIGATCGLLGAWTAIAGRSGWWPSWAKGALAAAIAGHLFCLGLAGASLALAKPQKDSKPGQARSYVTLLPTAAGWLHYVSHGVTLKASAGTYPPEGEPIVQNYRVGLLSGIQSDGKTKKIPGAAFIALLIPAICLFWGGRIAVRGCDNRFAAAAKMAACYALIITAATLLFNLSIVTRIQQAGISSRTAVSAGPSPAQAFVLGLVLALVFGTLGALTGRRDDRP